jgi:murein DD-endopeptidase MepM/ murein hydrolase activator NlpD
MKCPGNVKNLIFVCLLLNLSQTQLFSAKTISKVSLRKAIKRRHLQRTKKDRFSNKKRSLGTKKISRQNQKITRPQRQKTSLSARRASSSKNQKPKIISGRGANRQKVQNTRRSHNNKQASLPARGTFQWPIRKNKFWISTYFGRKARGRLHAGLDLAATKGTPVYSACAGRVEFAANAGTFGNMILIKHNKTFNSRYAHLHKIVVGRGKSVRKGELIGYVGNSGSVSGKNGHHLHFEVLANNRPVNPVRVLG